MVEKSPAFPLPFGLSLSKPCSSAAPEEKNSPSTSSGRTDQLTPSGFTLIEMIVALAVFSLAALALLRLEGATVSQTAMLDQRLLGQIVARNLAVEALTDPVPPPLGESRGELVNGGRDFRWTRQTSRTEAQRLVRVDIAVADASGETVGALTIVRGAQ